MNSKKMIGLLIIALTIVFIVGKFLHQTSATEDPIKKEQVKEKQVKDESTQKEPRAVKEAKEEPAKVKQTKEEPAKVDGAKGLPDKVEIIVIKDKKSGVVFPHKAHASVLQEKCGECHTKADGSGGLKAELKAKPVDMAEAMKHPFHVQCKGCHTSGKKGPTKCAECHQ